MKKHHTCDELGVCQGLGANQCPDCDSNECEVPCAAPPVPTRAAYPFAPGIIQGPQTTNYDCDDYSLPLSLRELAFVFGLVIVFSGFGGMLARWLQ